MSFARATSLIAYRGDPTRYLAYVARDIACRVKLELPMPRGLEDKDVRGALVCRVSSLRPLNLA